VQDVKDTHRRLRLVVCRSRNALGREPEGQNGAWSPIEGSSMIRSGRGKEVKRELYLDIRLNG
jgi:hypothetical protein